MHSTQNKVKNHSVYVESDLELELSSIIKHDINFLAMLARSSMDDKTGWSVQPLWSRLKYLHKLWMYIMKF